MVIVSGSGLIYGVIVVMWAAVLVPMWLRRHEDADEQFTTAMRALAHPAGYDRHTDDTRMGGAGSRWIGVGRDSLSLVRRRRTLGALVGLVCFFAATGVVGATAWPFAALSVAALVAYLVCLRVQARTVASVRPPVRRPRVTVNPGADDRMSGPVTAPAPPVAEESAAHEPDPGWEPVRIPPPTYATMPPAPSPARTIDLSRPGFWVDGWRVAAQASAYVDEGRSGEGEGTADVPETAASAGRAGSEEPFDQEAPDHRWVVND